MRTSCYFCWGLDSGNEALQLAFTLISSCGAISGRLFTFFFLTTKGLPLSSKVKSPLRSLLVNALKSFPRDYEPLSIFKSSSLIFCIFSFNSLSFFFFSSLAIKCFLQFSSHAVIGTLAGRSSFTYLGGEGFLSFADLRRLADDPSWLISEVVIYRFRPFLDPIET